MDVSEGAIIADRYRVERVIGRGGMGVVVAAVHIGLDERVAIKLLLRDERDASLDVARFLREARIAAKIKSEHVARVSDVGTLDDGTPFLVMEHLSGHDLARHLRDNERLAIPEAIDFVVQVCEGLSEAHALGIVHRDLKPSNLFLTRRRDGTVLIKVLDFGVSKLMSPGPGGALTRTTDVVGSPLYMSPEQMLSAKHVDARTDVWALGVILYELVSGEVPWIADTLAALCSVVLEMPPPPLVALRPDAPLALQAVINRCLAKNPADRYSDLGELARALAPFASPSSQPAIDRVARIVSLSTETRRVVAIEPQAARRGEKTVADSAPPTAPTASEALPTMVSPRGLPPPEVIVSAVTPSASAQRTLRAVSETPRAIAPAPPTRDTAGGGFTLGRALAIALVAVVLTAVGVYFAWREGNATTVSAPSASVAPSPERVAPPLPTASPAGGAPSVTPAIGSAAPPASAPSAASSARKPSGASSSVPRPHPADPPDSDFGSRH